MSHALAWKLLTNQNSTVRIYKNLSRGITAYPSQLSSSARWKRNIVLFAGPIGDIAFSILLLVAATALKSYLSWPVALVLGGGGVFWISGELLGAYLSASRMDGGDFGLIAQNGKIPLVLASAALVGECALGIFLAIRFAA